MRFKKEKRTDIILGIASWIFILLVFYIYFTQPYLSWRGIYIKGFGGSGPVKETDIPLNKTCEISLIKPTVLLRIDDVRAFSVPSIGLIDELLKRDMPATLGIIPRNLEEDKKLVSYLASLRNDPRIEFAQHGKEHLPSDAFLTEEEVLDGLTQVGNILGVLPTTYIPPYNTVGDETKEIITKHFEVISLNDGYIKEGEIAQIDQTIATFDYSKNISVEPSVIISSCDESLRKFNVCVITMHPQDFSVFQSEQEEIDIDKLDNVLTAIEKLKEWNISFKTFNQITDCKVSSLNSTTSSP